MDLIGPDGVFFGRRPAGVELAQAPWLMVMYGAGFALLFLLLAALHWRALGCLRRRDESAARLRALRVSLGACLVYVAVAAISILLALAGPTRWAVPASGFVYAFIGVAHYLYHAVLTPRLFPVVRTAP